MMRHHADSQRVFVCTTHRYRPGPAFKPTDGAAYGFNGSCTAAQKAAYGGCGMTGPEEVYEEFKFKTRVVFLS